MKIPNFLKCISCSHNNGQTQIKIRSSCFDKPIIINIQSDNPEMEKINEIIKNLIELNNLTQNKDNVTLTEVNI